MGSTCTGVGLQQRDEVAQPGPRNDALQVVYGINTFKIRFLCITRDRKSFRVRATVTENNCPSEIPFYADVMSC